MIKLVIILLLNSLSPTYSTKTAPGERVLELLAQVKSNTENHEEIADQHESIRAGVCQSKTTTLSGKISTLRSRLLAAGGHASNPSDAEQNATAAGRANVTETSIRDSIEEKHRIQDIDLYTHQISTISSLRDTISKGFQRNLKGFTTALSVRALSHDMFAAHQTQYDSYASTMDTMLSLMERHAGAEEAREAVRAAEIHEADQYADSMSKQAKDNMQNKVERHQRKELYDARAERLYEAVALASKMMAEHMALERALDNEADQAWDVASMEREQLSEDTDTMLEKLDDKKTTLQQDIRTLGGLMTGNATVKIVSADFEVIAKLEKEMTRARQELELWDGSCKSQADMFVASQTQRAGLIERLNKLESWIHESLTTAKSVVGASVMNSAHGDTTSSSSSSSSSSALAEEDDTAAAEPLSPEQVHVAHSAYAALQKHTKLSTLPLEGSAKTVVPNAFTMEQRNDKSIAYSFEVETDQNEIVRMEVVRKPKDSPTVEFASAEVVSSPSLPAAEQPKELNVKELIANLEEAATEKAIDDATNKEEEAQQ